MNKTRRKALIRIYAVLKEVKKKLKDMTRFNFCPVGAKV